MSKIQNTITKETEWEEVGEADIFEFKNKEDFVEGTLIHMESDVGKHKSKLYSLKQSNKKILKVWGSKILDSRLIGVSLGTTIKIVFKGEVNPEHGMTYKDFKVFKEKPRKEA